MEPLTDRQLRAALANCSRSERAAATLPDVTTLDWEHWDVLGWRDRRLPQRGYLVTPSNDGPVGIVLRAPEASVRRTAQCLLCYLVHQGAVALFVARRGGASGRNCNSRGTYICDDLACSRRIRQTFKPTRQLPDPEPVIAEHANALAGRALAFVQHVLAAA